MRYKTTLFTIAALLLFVSSCGQRQPKTVNERVLTELGISSDDLSGDTYRMEASEGALDCDGMDDASNPAPPPPNMIVGTWRAPAKRGHIAYLEIYVDGMAGLYLGDADSDQLYEIYRGTVLAVGDNPDEICLEMVFDLNWYIYESEDGAPVTGVPDTYKGIYTLRHYWDDDKQMLHVKANDDADPLFGRKELNMEWSPKTEDSGCMVNVESEG